MRFHFDADSIKALPTRGTAYRAYDTGERGLGLEVLPSGRKRFFVRRRPEPHAPPRQWNLGEFGHVTVRQARDEAYLIAGQIIRGEVEDRGASMRLEQFWEVYKERHLVGLAAASQRAYNEAWALADSLHHRPLESLTRADVARLHGEIGARSRSLADKVRAVLSSVLGRAEEWGYLDDAPKMPKPFGQVKRERWLTRDELAALFREIDKEGDPFGDLFRLLLFTGARKAEACGMAWADLRLDQRLWLRRQKGGTMAPTALSDPAAAILRRRANNSPWVFPSKAKGKHLVSPDKHWRAARGRANLPDVRIHDLRHTHASWLAQAGVSLQIIGAQLGHRQTSTTERYAHMAIDPQRKAVDLVADMIEGIA